MSASATPPLFDAVVRIDRMPASGRDLTVSLDEPTRAALAELLKLSAIDSFEATLMVAPLRGGLRAQGRLVADIVQPSVVTFEPVGQHVDEAIDRVFLPEAQAHKPTPGSEIFVDLEDEDFPDHIDGPEVDLSALLIETLALAIDPYPRLPGEGLDSLGVHLGDEPSGPFAALKKLKKSTDIDR
ncbi:YceD family protein [Devosia sp.]|uniref:YceD family protein n=1 Tax=Devosia sp. TaxID=1871048 RepID=UPI002FCAD2B0